VRVFRNLSGIRPNDIPCSVVALGTFDGVHLGHKKILEKCAGMGIQLNIPSVVFTFREHPLEIIRPGHVPELLTDVEDRLAFIEKAGIENTVMVDFDEKMVNSTPEEFVREVLVDSLRARRIIVGFNYTFGLNGQGDPAALEHLGKKYGFCVEVLEPVVINGEVISSSMIRSGLINGDVKTACRMLGRPFSIKGKVIRGESRGKVLGYPTVNFEVPHGMIIPNRGVYVTSVYIKGQVYSGVTNIGIRPTFSRQTTGVETHIIGFDGDLYGETLRLFFIEKLRNEIKFPSSEALVSQISRDVEKAKAVLLQWDTLSNISGIGISGNTLCETPVSFTLGYSCDNISE
jgi:riboflavin kinase/FMN adenylyltransferase